MRFALPKSLESVLWLLRHGIRRLSLLKRPHRWCRVGCCGFRSRGFGAACLFYHDLFDGGRRATLGTKEVHDGEPLQVTLFGEI